MCGANLKFSIRSVSDSISGGAAATPGTLKIAPAKNIASSERDVIEAQ
jgi:hypothetical protein